MSTANPLLRSARNEEGQAAALGGLLVFVAALSAMLVFTVGHRVREKVKVQSAADAAAFSLAVAQARAFNYFAFANRATVAHAVSVLSIESHQSYITFHEGLSQQAKIAFGEIAASLKKKCDKAKWAHNKYPECFPASCHATTPNYCPHPICMAACEDLPNALAAKKLHTQAANKLHQQWHKGWYHNEFMRAAEIRFRAIDKLYSDQNRVFRDLKNQIDVGNNNGVAQRIVGEIDPELRLLATHKVAVKNKKYLEDAVSLPSYGHSGAFADEWREAVAGTRWPTWITDRHITGLGGLENTSLWRDTNRLANRGNETSHEAIDVNIKIRGTSGLIGNVTKSANALETALRPNNADDLGGDRGFAAYDGGKLSNIVWYSWSVANFCSCRSESYCVSTGDLNDFEVGVYGTPNPSRGFHRFPEGMDTEKDMIGSCQHCFNSHTAYRGHPRFRLGNGLLLNQPRSTVVVAKPWYNRGQNDQRPWEFNFHADLPAPMKFDTRGATGATQGHSVGIATALTYYHKPGGDGWREPPNFWNPFWRAKLHPVKPADAAEVLPDWSRANMGTGALNTRLNH